MPLAPGVVPTDDAGMLTRFLFYPNGRARVRRMVLTIIALVFFAMFGTAFLIFARFFTGDTTAQTILLIIFVVLLKFPLIAFLWWLIGRNKEIPGVPVVWDAEETAQILAYLSAQARESMDRADAPSRLSYLSREAWHVADRADGEMKADAVGVALEIDRLAARARDGRRLT